MAGTQDILGKLEYEKDALKRVYGVKSLGVFGSWARGEATAFSRRFGTLRDPSQNKRRPSNPRFRGFSGSFRGQTILLCDQTGPVELPLIP